VAAADQAGAAVPAGGRERRDLSPRAVGLFFLGLVVAIGLVLVLTARLFDFLDARAARRDAAPSPLAAARPLPPPPRLQVQGRTDLQALHAAEDDILNGYGWVDRDAGVVRIPIDRAMSLLAERGLPSRGAERDGR